MSDVRCVRVNSEASSEPRGPRRGQVTRVSGLLAPLLGAAAVTGPPASPEAPAMALEGSSGSIPRCELAERLAYLTGPGWARPPPAPAGQRAGTTGEPEGPRVGPEQLRSGHVRPAQAVAQPHFREARTMGLVVRRLLLQRCDRDVEAALHVGSCRRRVASWEP